MKKIKYLFIAVAALISGTAMAQKITCADVTIENGKAELVFMVESDQPSTLAEFFLTMPTGIAIESDDEGYFGDKGSMCTRGHELSIQDRAAGDIYVLLMNKSKQDFKTTSGELVKIPIVAGNVVDGTYQIKVDGVNLTNQEPKQINTETSFVINVTVGTTGIEDVNGAEGALENGKYEKDGQITIVKNGKKYTTVGTSK